MKRDLSIIIPCQNEEESISLCIEESIRVIQDNKINAEIIIVNNASTDNTNVILNRYKKELDKKYGLNNFIKIVEEKKSGYGNAYRKGIEHTEGKYILMIDCDGSYSFDDLILIYKKLLSGYDFVIGNRFSNKMEKGSMPYLHSTLGRFLFSSLLFKYLFDIQIHDVHCGLRGVKSESVKDIKFKCGGMDFASEMIIKPKFASNKIYTIDISYNKRFGRSKLKTFRDGFRHLLIIFKLYLFK